MEGSGGERKAGGQTTCRQGRDLKEKGRGEKKRGKRGGNSVEGEEGSKREEGKKGEVGEI